MALNAPQRKRVQTGIKSRNDKWLNRQQVLTKKWKLMENYNKKRTNVGTFKIHYSIEIIRVKG